MRSSARGTFGARGRPASSSAPSSRTGCRSVPAFSIGPVARTTTKSLRRLFLDEFAEDVTASGELSRVGTALAHLFVALAQADPRRLRVDDRGERRHRGDDLVQRRSRRRHAHLHDRAFRPHHRDALLRLRRRQVAALHREPAVVCLAAKPRRRRAATPDSLDLSTGRRRSPARLRGFRAVVRAHPASPTAARAGSASAAAEDRPRTGAAWSGSPWRSAPDRAARSDWSRLLW